MTHCTPARPGSTRLFKAQVSYFDCGVVREVKTFTIHLTKTATTFTATIDGQPAELDDARNLLMLARAKGTLTETGRSEPEAAVIGKAVASKFHKELARLGIAKHYACAQEALGYPVGTLAALTAEEAVTVWGYACSLAECPTLPSVVFGLVA